MYFDKLIRSADLETDIHALARIHVDADIASGELREALVLDGDLIETDLDVEKVVVAAVVGADLGFDARVLAAKRHERFRNGRAGSIRDGAKYFGGFKLAEEQSWNQKTDEIQ